MAETRDKCCMAGPDIEVSRVVVISIAHVSEATIVKLQSQAIADAEYFTGGSDADLMCSGVSMYVSAFGVIVPCVQGDPALGEPDIPEDLRGVLSWAAEQRGCDYVLLDRDAPVVPSLKTYDW